MVCLSATIVEKGLMNPKMQSMISTQNWEQGCVRNIILLAHTVSLLNLKRRLFKKIQKTMKNYVNKKEEENVFKKEENNERKGISTNATAKSIIYRLLPTMWTRV